MEKSPKEAFNNRENFQRGSSKLRKFTKRLYKIAQISEEALQN